MSLLAAYPKQTPSRTFASVYSGEKAVEKGKKEYDAGREYSTIILDWKMPRHERPHRQAHLSGYPENALGSCLRKD